MGIEKPTAEEVKRGKQMGNGSQVSRIECPECGTGYRHALGCSHASNGGKKRNLNMNMTNLERLECPETIAYLSPEHAAACKWAAAEIKRLEEKDAVGAADLADVLNELCVAVQTCAISKELDLTRFSVKTMLQRRENALPLLAKCGY